MSVNGVLSCKRDIHIILLTLAKAQGPLQNRGGKTVRARGQRETVEKVSSGQEH